MDRRASGRAGGYLVSASPRISGRRSPRRGRRSIPEVKAREDDWQGDEKPGRFFTEDEADAGKRVGAEIRGEQDEEDRAEDWEDPRTDPSPSSATTNANGAQCLQETGFATNFRGYVAQNPFSRFHR